MLECQAQYAFPANTHALLFVHSASLLFLLIGSYPLNSPPTPHISPSHALSPSLPSPQAFADVDRDMTERETPMDRLVCGDVGFGKTEVALRAVFQAVLDGRQVRRWGRRVGEKGG